MPKNRHLLHLTVDVDVEQSPRFIDPPDSGEPCACVCVPISSDAIDPPSLESAFTTISIGCYVVVVVVVG